MIHNIPFELQQLDQWVVATGALLPDGKRDKVPLNPRTGYKADVCDRSTWGSFREAQQCGYPLIGFVLSKEDPYAIIDLDDPRADADSQEIIDIRTKRHELILKAFQSYSEVSQSGNGVHIICKGAVPHGVRRDKVEIYSDSRYMICTGNVFNPLPIIDCQETVLSMYHQMNAVQPTTDLVQVDGTLTDDQIYHMASTAANASKFAQLWQGEWKGNAEWPSQSEADFALLAMLCFYTKDNEQVRRIFRWSALGRREKAQPGHPYLDFALRKIRAKELPPIDFSLLIKHNEQLNLPLNGNNVFPTGAEETIAGASPATQVDEDPVERKVESSNGVGEAYSLTYPPGFIGELAEYFYSSAIRPVPEIALAAAIALTAGVVGRTYNISGSGLNQYLVVIAKTGSGKEGAAKGIDKLISMVRSQVPMADKFIGPGGFASGQGLLRAMDRQPCFISVLGEIGLQLKAICDPKASPAQVILKKVLLDIYAKSGFESVLRPNVYSETEKDTKLVQAPNVTIFGESTPENFFDSLDASNIAEGLVPRFSIFEYDGPRPPRNTRAFGPPPKELVNNFATLLSVAIAAEQNRAFCPVQVCEEAQAAFDAFDKRADEEMNSARFDVNLQLWNRAHLKALKLGALIAVGVNPHQPVVDLSGAQWAIALTERDIKKLLKHFSSGDIGQGDERMEADLRRAIDDFLRMKPKARREYRVPEPLLEVPVVPLGYLRRRLRALASYRNHRLGSNLALANVLKALIEAGEIQQMSPIQSSQMFKITTPLYVCGVNW